jgi:hypothetical protein
MINPEIPFLAYTFTWRVPGLPDCGRDVIKFMRLDHFKEYAIEGDKTYEVLSESADTLSTTGFGKSGRSNCVPN